MRRLVPLGLLFLFLQTASVVWAGPRNDDSTLTCPAGVERMAVKFKVPGDGNKKSHILKIEACDIDDGTPHEFAYSLDYKTSSASYQVSVAATARLLRPPWPADGPNPRDRAAYFALARPRLPDNFPHGAMLANAEIIASYGWHSDAGVFQFDGPDKKPRVLILDGPYQWLLVTKRGGVKSYKVTGHYQSGEKVGLWESSSGEYGKLKPTEQETFEIINGVGFRTKHIVLCKQNPVQAEHVSAVDYSKSDAKQKPIIDYSNFDCESKQRILHVVGPGAPRLYPANPLTYRPKATRPGSRGLISHSVWTVSGQLKSERITLEDGTRSTTEWWPNGQKRESETGIGEASDGLFQRWNQDGVLVEAGYKKYNGRGHRTTWRGSYRSWFDDGTLKEVGVKEHGMWKGLYFEFEPNGVLKSATLSRLKKLLTPSTGSFKPFMEGEFEAAFEFFVGNRELLPSEAQEGLAMELLNAYTGMGVFSPTRKGVSCEGLYVSGLLADSGYCRGFEMIENERLSVSVEQRMALGFRFAKDMLSDGHFPAFLYRGSGGGGREGTASEVVASIENGTLPLVGRFAQVHKLIEEWPHLSEIHRTKLRVLTREATAQYLESAFGFAQEESERNARMACFGDCSTFKCRVYQVGAPLGQPFRRENVCASSEAGAKWKTEDTLCEGMGTTFVGTQALGLLGTGGYNSLPECQRAIECDQTQEKCATH
jgi:hypothetical protein